MSSNERGGRGGIYYGWGIVGVGVLSQISVNGLVINSLSLFLHQWSLDMHVPISHLLRGMIGMMIVMGLLSPLIGGLADKKPARLLMGIGLAAMSLSCLAMSRATNAWHILLLYGLAFPVPIMLGSAIVTNSVISRWFVKRLGLALGLSTFGIGFAGVILPPIIVEALPVIGWRNIWLIGGLVIGLIALPLVLLLMRDRPTEREGLDYVNIGEAAPTRVHGHGSGGGLATMSWMEIVKQKNFWLVLAVFFPLGCIIFGSMNNLVPLVMSHGFDQKTGALTLSTLNFVHLGANIIMGLLSDRFGNRVPLVLLALAGVCGALLLAFSDSFLGLIVGAGLVGFGNAVWVILPAAAAAAFGAVNVGRAFGLFMLAIPILGTMPMLVAKAQETTGSYVMPMVILASLTMVGASFVMFFFREAPKLKSAEVTAS